MFSNLLKLAAAAAAASCNDDGERSRRENNGENYDDFASISNRGHDGDKNDLVEFCQNGARHRADAGECETSEGSYPQHCRAVSSTAVSQRNDFHDNLGTTRGHAGNIRQVNNHLPYYGTDVIHANHSVFKNPCARDDGTSPSNVMDIQVNPSIENATNTPAPSQERDEDNGTEETDKETAAVVKTGANTWRSGIASLAEAAASGCRKCRKELDTGDKTRKGHDAHCPRKWRSVGANPLIRGCPKKQEEELSSSYAKKKTFAGSVRQCKMTLRKESGTRDELNPTSAMDIHVQGDPRVSADNRLASSLTEVAASGCKKCQKELDTGAKTTKGHDERCPRKWQSGGCPIAKHAPAPVQEEEREDERRSSNAQDVVCNAVVSLAEAAASGCRKCQKELDTGVKTRKEHDERCLRKRGSSNGGYTKQEKELASRRATKKIAHNNKTGRQCKMTLRNKSCTRDELNRTKTMHIHVQGDPHHDHATRRSARNSSSPALFVARSSTSGVSVTERDALAADSRCTFAKKATLAESASSGCRKCQKELETGEKTRREHDDQCPRKRGSVGVKEEREDDKNESNQNKFMWSVEEDMELVKRVHLHCEGNWKAILDNSRILQERYANAPSDAHARWCIKGRWRLKHMKADSDLDQENATESSSTNSDSSGSEGSIESEDEDDKNESNQNKSMWSVEEDMELVKRVRKHGEGNWKAILDNSRILQERYANAPSDAHARWCIKGRWRLKHMNVDSDLDLSHDDESITTSTNPDSPGDEDSVQIHSVLAEDDSSVVSSMDMDVSAYEEGDEDDSSILREDWEYIPWMNRQSLLKLICENKSSPGDMSIVQISQRGSIAKDVMKHFFLIVPDIISKGKHEDRDIPADSLFVMLQVEGIISIYNEHGKQVGDDRTPWDIFAQAAGVANAGTVFWAVDNSGSHVGRVAVPKYGGVHKWFSLLHHMEQDRLERADHLHCHLPLDNPQELLLGKRNDPPLTSSPGTSSSDTSVSSERGQVASGYLRYLETEEFTFEQDRRERMLEDSLIANERKRHHPHPTSLLSPRKKKVTCSSYEVDSGSRQQISSDCLQYFEKSRHAFTNSPQVYSDLVRMVAEFQAMEFDTISFVCGVITLLDGHNDLILGINGFLPEMYMIESTDLGPTTHSKQNS